jgi:hypothetical protein
MIDKLIDKYGAILNTLKENKSTKSDTDFYDYNNDIKNNREYLKDLKALKQALNIPVVSKCEHPEWHNFSIDDWGKCKYCNSSVKI